MPSYLNGVGAPGTYVGINNQTIGRPAPLLTSDAAMFAGYSTWGPPNTPTHITGLAEYTRRFGKLHPNSRLTDAVHLFFREGGSHSIINRVVGPAAAVATLVLVDRTGGGALNTVRVNAKYASSTVRVYVTVEAGDMANTVKLTFDTPDLPLQPEIYNNVKVTITADEATAIAEGSSKLTSLQYINGISNLVQLVDMGSASNAPTDLPALLARTLIPGGTDDFGSLTDAHFIGVAGPPATGLQAFNSEEFGPGQIAIPGITTTAAHQAIAAAAYAFKRVPVLDFATGTDKTAAIAERANLGANPFAIYWPPMGIAFDLAGNGAKKNYPMSGAVAAIFAVAEREVGVHKAPAGYPINSFLDVERDSGGAIQTDEATRALLNRNEINVVTPMPGQGIMVYGARIGSSDPRVTAIHQLRVLYLTYYQLRRSYNSLVFGVLDHSGRMFREAKSVTEQFLHLLWRAGALTSRSGEEKDAYVVICDDSNNSPETLQEHQLYVDIGMHIVDMAEMIFISVNNLPGSVDFGILRNE